MDALSRKDKPLTPEDSYLVDFAKIGSLLTDKPRCIAHLAKINTALLTLVEVQGMRQRATIYRTKQKDLKTADVD